MLKKKNTKMYTVISSLFLLVCLIFVARLVNLQFDPNKTAQLRDESEYTTETQVIQALRGNICDRNGNVLVTTSYAYDILFDYNYMPDDFVQFNKTILAVVDALSKTQNNEYRTKDLFPFAGEYPNYTYSTEALTVGTPTYNALQKMLRELDMEGASAEELTQYFVKRWKYTMKDKNGEDVYSSSDINKLIRVRYDMLRTQFSSITPYCIASGVDIGFVTYIKELSIAGVSDRISTQRTYIYPGYASHILGKLGEITSDTWDHYRELGYSMDAMVGIDGCEAAFEEYLRGKNGVKTITRNADGVIIKEEITTEPIAGKDVWLTIDIDTQIAAENALAEYMQSFDKETGASVAIDPQSGDILAIASYPTYDLTTFSKDYNSLLQNENLPLLNRAFGAAFAPGSTFKLAVALAALEEGAITPSTYIHCDHGYTKHGMNIKCNNHNSHSSPYLNVTEAIMYSCNAFFIETGYDKLDINTMQAYCEKLGLGQASGIELPELLGQISCPDNADVWDAYNEAATYIGQAIHKYTPLQVTSYVSTVANGGTRYAAHLLHSVRTFSGDVVYEYEKQVLSNVGISSSSLGTIKTGMRRMVENSPTSSYNFYTKHKIDATVCGKSGTAQVGNGKQNCWFTAFAPMENPRIVVTSLIENGSSGASVSAIDAAVISAYLNK